MPRLVDRLEVALEATTHRDQVILTGTEIARAILRQREAPPQRGSLPGTLPEAVDAGIGVNAMRQVLALNGEDVGALILMARVLLLQRVWAEARDTLLHALAAAKPAELEARIHAYFLLADLYDTKLGDPGPGPGRPPGHPGHRRQEPPRAGAPRAARHRPRRPPAHRADPGPPGGGHGRRRRPRRDRSPPRRGLPRRGRRRGTARAYADAVASAPHDGRAWTALSRLYRAETPDGAAAYAASLQQVLDVAAARRLPVDPRWLTTLGMLEISVLLRPTQGVGHLTQAAQMPGASADVRATLARGLEACGRTGEAITLFREVLLAEADTFARLGDLPAALASLESAFAKEGRMEDRLAVEEVRACLGDVKPDRATVFRGRRLVESAPYPGSLLAADRARLMLPEARTILLDLSQIIAPIAAKILRFELSGLGVGSRDRLSPRDGHPTRFLADRVARALGVEAFEIYLSPSWQGAMRVYPGDPPALVGSTSFAELPEGEQIFALARLLTRIALGPTWLDELPADAVDGLFLAVMRSVEPSFGSGEISAGRDAMAGSFLAAVQKAMGRRQKKQIEELAGTVPAGYDARAITIAVRRSEYRIAYVLTGDLVAAIDYLRRFDRDIGRSADDPRLLLTHPVTNEMLRYALSAEAVSERRRIGSFWA